MSYSSEPGKRGRPSVVRPGGLLATLAVTAIGILIVVVLLASRPAALTPRAPSAGPETATAANSSAPVLGTRLGAISFETRPAEVLRILGEPQTRTLGHGSGTPVWQYANGLRVALVYGPGSQTPDEVWQLVATPPFAGATAEGFRLGDSEAEFARVYRNYSVRTSSHEQYTSMVILDSNLRKLVAQFGPDGRAVSISLTERCNTCYPAMGTPGPNKGP